MVPQRSPVWRRAVRDTRMVMTTFRQLEGVRFDSGVADLDRMLA